MCVGVPVAKSLLGLFRVAADFARLQFAFTALLNMIVPGWKTGIWTFPSETKK